MFNFFGFGNLTKDIELKKAGETAVVNFDIAVNEYYKVGEEKKENVYFFTCEAWGSGAERLANYKKGDCLFIKGILRQDRFTDKDTGKEREKVKLRVQEFRYIPRLPKE